MTFNFLLGDSQGWTLIFAALVAVAVFTQLMKEKLSIPFSLRALLKAAPALFLAGLSLYLEEELVAAVFLFCGLGDILLDLPEEKAPLAFELGAGLFAAALLCVSIASYQKPFAGRPLLPLALTNIVIAIFILRWVLAVIPKSRRALEVSYFGILIIANIFASTSNVPIFLGSSLWFMSDLSIGLSSYVSNSPTNSLDTLGLYDLGLYFLAIGFLNL